ncbi:MAG: Swt1 family HEPN domain-containing protein, partial [Chloroflexota bacterium]|nr:Swt1 family HEPN domain-containing protein [Chloroflexota bacterium]
MSQSNHERVGRALQILNQGLKSFIEREMQAKYGSRWQYEAAKSLREQHFGGGTDDIHLDTQALLLIMWDQWHEVFRQTLGHAERNYVSELREARNRWAHENSFSTEQVYRILDSIQLLLTSISAEEAQQIERQKQEVLRVRFDEQARHETRKAASAATVGYTGNGGLRPWREIITPHPDVTRGTYQLAEFAADLNQVYRGEGTDEYRVPRDFFQRTFLTEGLKRLLIGALQRLNGVGGDPIVELHTNFGGGKTHSMLALYHLFSGESPTRLLDIEKVMAAANVTELPTARRAVLVGTALSPAQPHVKDDGTVISTLWGEMAWQLLGRTGFAMVAESDARGVSPGSDVLREIFVQASPCLILIDEWVAYARQMYHKNDLSGGSFDANITFAQALTEAAKAAPRTLVVASIPSSDNEVGGEGGREALARLRNTFARVESSWRPADEDESFEIVRRRLFQPVEAHHAPIRDAVIKAFGNMYRTQRQEFPSECGEGNYERRLKGSYPIHPELFNRLYNDWSSIDKFQRTRGVLRLMANVIQSLWENQDTSLLIMPANIPLNIQRVQSQLTDYLEETWIPVIDQDIDGSNSLPLKLDQENQNFGRYSACRRVARTIFLGSAPSMRNPNRGLIDRQIKLGCVQPSENTGTFGDALRRLTDHSNHLYLSNERYWYSTQASVTRMAQERAARYEDDDLYDEIEKRLKSERNTRGEFSRVHDCPASSADIEDDTTSVRLVLLKPSLPHALRDSDSAARQ